MAATKKKKKSAGKKKASARPARKKASASGARRKKSASRPATRKKTAKKTAKKSAATRKAGTKRAPRQEASFWQKLFGVFGVLAIATGVGYAIQQSSAQKGFNPSAKVEVSKVLGSQFKRSEGLSASDRVAYWSSEVARWTRGRNPIFRIKDVSVVVDDTAPIFPRSFNSTTYLETVAALAASRSDAQVIPNLMQLRYEDGEATYENRNHFPSIDWIPNNLDAGTISDVTSTVIAKSGVDVKIAQMSINKKSWLKGEVAAGRVTPEVAGSIGWDDDVSARLRYIPSTDVPKVSAELRSGDIVNVVRQPISKFPVLVSHQGFLIKDKRGRLLLRLANRAGKIETKLLDFYLEPNYSKVWPVVGINVNRLRLD